jgi:hypothetical protein
MPILLNLVMAITAFMPAVDGIPPNCHEDQTMVAVDYRTAGATEFNHVTRMCVQTDELIATWESAGVERGWDEGYDRGSWDGYEVGHADGIEVGIDEGYAAGFEAGYAAAADRFRRADPADPRLRWEY